MSKEKNLEKYISRIEEACGDGRDFIVILNPASRKRALKRIFDKCQVGSSLRGVMIKTKYKGKEVSVFTTGKLILKGLAGRKSAEKLLREMLA